MTGPFVFMVMHYPSPERRDELARGMAEMRGAMESRPGCLGVEPPLLTPDGSCLIGYSRWESEEAFRALGLTFGDPGDIPDGELRPRQRFFLTAYALA